MGLDIFVYPKLQPLPENASTDERENAVWVYVAGSNWKSRMEPYSDGHYLRPEKCAASFRAGSYGGYNEFRRALCKFALDVEPEAVWENPGAFAGRPFVELIDFSDCEGCIGPVVAAKLAKDFDDHAEKWAASLFKPTGDPLRLVVNTSRHRIYEDWRKAFRLAADAGGVVKFS